MALEGRRIVDVARGQGVVLRLLGGMAVHEYCAGLPACRRDHHDLDMVALRRQTRSVIAVFGELGYEERVHARMATAAGQAQFVRDCVHGQGFGRQRPHAMDSVDVFFDEFKLDHVIDLRARLSLHPYAIPLTDALTAKLQMHAPSRVMCVTRSCCWQPRRAREVRRLRSTSRTSAGSVRATGVCSRTCHGTCSVVSRRWTTAASVLPSEPERPACWRASPVPWMPRPRRWRGVSGPGSALAGAGGTSLKNRRVRHHETRADRYWDDGGARRAPAARRRPRACRVQPHVREGCRSRRGRGGRRRNAAGGCRRGGGGAHHRGRSGGRARCRIWPGRPARRCGGRRALARPLHRCSGGCTGVRGGGA